MLSKSPPLRSADGGAAVATLRHTQRISAARHRENEERIGSSDGSGVKPVSPCTNLRHFMPHRSVCKKNKKNNLDDAQVAYGLFQQFSQLSINMSNTINTDL